jgi:transposase
VQEAGHLEVTGARYVDMLDGFRLRHQARISRPTTERFFVQRGIRVDHSCEGKLPLGAGQIGGAQAASQFRVLPKRRIVERTFTWLGRCRRHSKNYKRNPETSEALFMSSMIRLLSRILALYNSF